MSKIEAIKALEAMPEDQFQAFFKRLPGRVQLLVSGRMVDWRECLADWYIRERGCVNGAILGSARLSGRAGV